MVYGSHVFTNFNMLARAAPGLSRIVSFQRQRCVVGADNDTVRPGLMQLASFSVRSTQLNHPDRLGSGDRGPERNYERKVMRKARKEASKKLVDTERMLAEMKNLESQEVQKLKTENAKVLKGLLSDIKVHIPSNADVRRRLGMPERKEVDRLAPRLKGRDSRTHTHFMDPGSGKRLGIFEHPKPGMTVMPPHKPSLVEEDEARKLQSFLMLRPKTQFQTLIEDTKFPRKFPIDNEEAIEIEEKEVGFEDHVLLDHLLEGFPAKGPVRHFMELVVTGLSKNPSYTAREKQEYVEWYRKYFSQFTPEELQVIPAARMELDSQQK